MNKSDEITYARRDVATQIDVCLASSKLSTYVDHFVERGAIPSSDHISLEFIIKLDPGPPKEVWAFTKTNWPNFVKELESISAKHFESFEAKSTTYDELKLNQAALKLEDDLWTAIKHNTPRILLKAKVPEVGWHDGELKELSKKLGKIESSLRMQKKGCDLIPNIRMTT